MRVRGVQRLMGNTCQVPSGARPRCKRALSAGARVHTHACSRPSASGGLVLGPQQPKAVMLTCLIQNGTGSACHLCAPSCGLKGVSPLLRIPNGMHMSCKQLSHCIVWGRMTRKRLYL